MNKVRQLLKESLTGGLYQMTLSGATGEATGCSKKKIRPVLLKDRLLFQITAYRGTQVFHENHTEEETAAILEADVSEDNVKVSLSHNRKKRYILEEGRPVPFLVDLGVQTKEGKVITSRYDKFRQINRFLEFIEDIWPLLPKDRPVHIIDFGCGKSYLTFAMYYYLHELKGLTLEVTGLDLKKDVIVHCNELAKKYHYEGLSFLHGDIADYTGTDSVDMAVPLHACDTATDYALYKAMKWHAGVILSVPCCQHEVNKQIACEPLEGALKYGLIKERLSALFTDALRADLLEENGYDTQVLEFIDMEHTPKNILLRAVRRVDAGMADGQSGLTEAEQKLGQCSKEPGYKKPDSKRLAETLQIHTTLQKLLEGELV